MRRTKVNIMTHFIKAIGLISLFLLINKRSLSQEQFLEGPAKQITSFPFKLLSGGVILIRASVDEYSDSLNFILDTGSGGISLDSTTVRALNINTVPSDKTIKGIGGIRKVSFLYGSTLHLPDLDVKSLDFHVNDYELLSYSYGIHIDGIIGYSFLSRYIVNINYDNRIITVYSNGDFNYSSGGHILYPAFTTLPIQSIQFRESKNFSQRFYFDTGAGLNFLLSEDYVADSSVLRKRKKTPMLTQAEGLGGKLIMRLTTVKIIQFGPYKFRNVPTLLFQDNSNVTAYPFLGGLIGNDLLRRFNVTLNYNRHEIHIIPNSHFKDFFDYAYSGLSIYFINQHIEVDEVVPDSPAAKAGFKKGDIILSVDNDFSNNIQTYKSIIQSTLSKIKFLILRNGTPEVIIMKTVRIL